MAAKSSVRVAAEPVFVLRPALVWLVLLTVLLSGIGAAVGAFSSSAGAPLQATSVYGAPVTLYGQGLYRYDTLMAGAGFRGGDFATLFVGIPLTLAALWWAGRGSLRGALLLVGAMGYLLYATLSVAVGVMYNPLHLLYIAAFSAAFFGTVMLLLGFGVRGLQAQVAPTFARRWVGGFMVFAGVGTALAWLPAALAALAAGGPPKLLGAYTTSVTNVIDLGLIVPAAILAGVLVWRRAGAGILISALLLGILVMLAPLMAGQTIFQLRAGVELSMGEIVGILGVFGALSLLGLMSLILLLRAVRDVPTADAITAPRPSRPATVARS